MPSLEAVAAIDGTDVSLQEFWPNPDWWPTHSSDPGAASSLQGSSESREASVLAEYTHTRRRATPPAVKCTTRMFPSSEDGKKGQKWVQKCQKDMSKRRGKTSLLIDIPPGQYSHLNLQFASRDDIPLTNQQTQDRQTAQRTAYLPP